MEHADALLLQFQHCEVFNLVQLFIWRNASLNGTSQLNLHRSLMLSNIDLFDGNISHAV